MATFPGVTARYVRWEVTAINAAGHSAVGGAEIAFFTTGGPRRPAGPRSGDDPAGRNSSCPGRKQVQPVTITVDHRYAEAVRASLEMEGLAPIRWS